MVRPQPVKNEKASLAIVRIYKEATLLENKQRRQISKFAKNFGNFRWKGGGKLEPKIIAMAGKGGVGKTSLAAAMVKVLVQAYPGKKILAIDAEDRKSVV